MEDKNKEKINVVELFGSNVFNDKIMQERLPKKVYKELHKTIDEGKELDPITAEVVAGAMKDWAVEKGATHYTHWFQPLTGFTAEKHDAFITAPHADGTVSMDFSVYCCRHANFCFHTNFIIMPRSLVKQTTFTF